MSSESPAPGAGIQKATNGVSAHGDEAALLPSQVLRGARLIVVGGTGFLGKVWVSLLLHRFPEVGHIYLVVRTKGEQTAEERFWAQIASSVTFDPLRQAHPGEAFEAFLRAKVTPVAGDMVLPSLGIDAALVETLRGRIQAVVNVSGVVDFNPPLDEALEVNAFGVNNLVTLARTLGAAVMHTSTCYVAGYRSGLVEEADPTKVPFPRAAGEKSLGEYQPRRTLETSHWDPQREIEECLDLIRMARHRSNDAFRQSAFSDEAKKNLEQRGEPSRGRALEDELAKVKRKFVAAQLVDAGKERALFWGWSNIYTYTKSIGEQVLAASGVPFTIVRPAVVESSCEYPVKGWNEGINTSAPYIYMAFKGAVRFPGDSKVHLDIIPCDMVASGMLASLCDLIAGTHEPVYQYGTTDSNPCAMTRYLELIGLYKRRRAKDGVFDMVAQHFESMGVPKRDYLAWNPHRNADAMRGLGKALGKLSIGPLGALLRPAASALEGAAKMEDRQGDIMDLFIPFTAECDWIFSCANIREAFRRMPPDERAKFIWYPETLDWRAWMYEVHLPGLEKWVIPAIDEKARKELKALRAYDHLLDLLDEVAERHDHKLGLQEVTPDGLTRVTYRFWRDATHHVAEQLIESGVAPGDRVVLSGRNQPGWGIAYFGILRAGAVAVPVDPALEGAQLLNIVRSSAATCAIWDAGVEAKGGPHVRRALPSLAVLDVDTITNPTEAQARLARMRTPGAKPSGEDVASIIYTSGTTGEPKGVMLMHKNFTALLAALAPIFPLTERDHVLSVLPLHHTFEFTCGLLLPLMLGARTIYLRELTSDGLREGLVAGRITAMAGVPALWQMLERRIVAEVKERGPLAMRAFDIALELNRLIGKKSGMNAGRLFFGAVHEGLGGRMRHLISGGAALPKDTAKLFAGLGLPLSEGYGLTEAAPVLTVAKASMKASYGNVGEPVPGVEISIASPDSEGVGEVLARGPNVMKGYEGNAAATAQVIDESGWLHTGDLGKIDKRGRLSIVGRSKEVIVGPSGENVYPDDVENLLGDVAGIKELSVVGLPDGQGGERVACLVVPARGADDESAAARSERRELAQKNLRDAVERLPRVARPTMVHFIDADLPRTATRKVKRNEVRELLVRLADATASAASVDGGASQVRQIVASLANKPLAQITSTTSLRGDLGVDSLLAVELAAALESAVGSALDAKELARAETVADLEELVRRMARTREDRALAAADGALAAVDEIEHIVVPEPVATATKRALTRVQMGFYANVMRPRVYGRAHIPHNRNTIVTSNHASHLDMGFVKYALGTYGEDIVSLAAQDYFFEGNKWRRAYFENFTNLAPFDRKGGLRQALRIAGEHLEQGHTVLIFPEGTRTVDGGIQEFKPAIGYLALTKNVDILPVYLGGTFEAMKKGTRVPTRRDIHARIGLPLQVKDLQRLTEGMKFSAACRRVAELAEEAVRALKDGRVLDIRLLQHGQAIKAAPAEHPLARLFRELETRFRADRVERPLTFYFTLGNEADDKWTLRVDSAGCNAAKGKPDGGAADCVLKTSTEIFMRIVRESYVPTPMEFMSGAVKSNDISLLQTFQKVFDL